MYLFVYVYVICTYDPIPLLLHTVSPYKAWFRIKFLYFEVPYWWVQYQGNGMIYLFCTYIPYIYIITYIYTYAYRDIICIHIHIHTIKAMYDTMSTYIIYPLE